MKLQCTFGIALGGLVWVLTACGSESRCGKSACSDSQLCDQATLLCVDNVEPTITISEPSGKAVLTGDVLSITGAIIDDEGKITGAELSIDQGVTWSGLNLSESGSFAVELALPKLDSKPLNIVVRARDRLEQEGRAEAAATVDNVAPACSALTVTEGQVFNIATGATYDLRFSATDGSGEIMSAAVSTGAESTLTPVELADGVATHVWTIPVEDYALNTVAFRAEDPHGNGCEVSTSIVVDMVAPSVTISTDGSDRMMFGGPGVSTANISGTASDGSGVAVVTFDFADGAGARDTEAVAGGWNIVVPLGAEDFVEHPATARVVDAAGNEATALVNIVVDTVAPKLNFLTPSSDEKFNIAKVPSTGVITVEWSAHDGDSLVKSRVRTDPQGQWTDSVSSSLLVATNANDNPQPYTIKVELIDSMQNKTNGTLTFHVDRVAPVITAVSPATNTRLAPRELSLTFSEPVTFKVPANTLVSPNGGTYIAGGATHVLSNLAGDTIFSAGFKAGIAEDAFGNPNPSRPGIQFHTEAAQPTSGYVLPLTVDAQAAHRNRLDVRSDQDGVVSISVATTSPAQSWIFGWFDPTTGAWAQRDSLFRSSEPSQDITTFAHRVLQFSSLSAVPLAAVRIHGMTRSQLNQGPIHQYTSWDSWWFEDAAGPKSPPSVVGVYSAVVPVPRGKKDPAGALVGWMNKSGQYERPNLDGTTFSEDSKLTRAFAVAPVSGDLWHLFGYDGSNIVTVARQCNYFSCGFEFHQTLGSAGTHPEFSHAAPGARGIALWTNGTTRHEGCFSACNPTPSHPFCAALPAETQTYPAAEELHVAPQWKANMVLGARKTSSGIELLERDLGTTCASSWSSLGHVPGSTAPSITEWRPVMFGKKPGVVYLDGTQLKVWIK